MRTGLLCPKGHHFTAKHPIGIHETNCPFCTIENIEQEFKHLKKWIREANR